MRCRPARWRAALVACLTPWSLVAQTPVAAPARDALDAAVVAALPWQRETVGVGVELRRVATDRLFDAPQSIAVLTVDLDASGTRIDVAAPDPFARVPTSRLASIAGALAAVNGGFFDTSNGTPIGLVVQDGLERAPDAARANGAALCVDARGRASIRAPGGGPAPRTALGAWPRLVAGGAVATDALPARDPRHPRTAVGTAADGKLVLIAVDGRNTRAAGMTLRELADFVHALGCREALNLDGGGSTTMWVRHLAPQIVNHPCDNRRFDAGGERAVANALLVFAAAIVERDEDRGVLTPGDGFRQLEDAAALEGDALVATAAAAELRFDLDVPDGGPWRIEVRLPDGPDVTLEVAVDGQPPATVPSRGARHRYAAAGMLPESTAAPRTITVRGRDGARFAFDALRLVETPRARGR